MIYLDHSATTPVDPKVLEAMLPYFSDNFANPSSIYSLGRESARELNECREVIATILKVNPEQFVFTSGGTESCNLAVFGIAKASPHKHIVTSKVEHSSVLKACEQLEFEGYKVDYIDVDKNGVINLAQLQSLVTPETALVSIMYVNNEIGTIQPVHEIAKICAKHKVPFHSDACQAAAYLELDPVAIGISALTVNSGKIYGPKGVGGLYVNDAIPFSPQIVGGEQEFGLRAGTENLPAIVGFAKAFELMQQDKELEIQRITALRNKLLSELLRIEGVTLNGSTKNRIANNINISITGIEGESALIRLDQKGIFVATGSACSSTLIEPSHVLLALGLTRNQAHSSLRISLGKSNDESQIPFIVESLKEVIEDLRNLNNSSW